MDSTFEIQQLDCKNSGTEYGRFLDSRVSQLADKSTVLLLKNNRDPAKAIFVMRQNFLYFKLNALNLSF